MVISLLPLASVIPVKWIVAPFLVWLFAWILLRPFLRQRSFPPGPRPWPVIGNLNLIGELPHRSLHKLSQTYGPMMQLKFGSTSVVVTNSPDIAKEFLKTHDSIFVSRPQLTAGKYTVYNFSNVTWAPHGPHWRQVRKMLQSNVFSSSRMDFFEYIRIEERRNFIRRLYDARGQQVRIKDQFFGTSLRVISRLVLGISFSSDLGNPAVQSTKKSEVTAGELQGMMEELLFLNGVFVIGDWIPWLARLDLEGYVKRMKTLSKKFDNFLDPIIAERTARQQKEEAKDIMDVILDYINNTGLEVQWNTEHAKAITIDMFGGGTDTSTNTVEWAVAALLKNPGIIKKAKEELDMVIGQDRWVEEEDIANLPFLNAIVKEAMRLYPTVTLLPPHLAMEDCQVKQYDISKGTLVIVNLWSMGRDPTLWDSPEEFRPERFLNTDIDIKGQSYKFMPFGSGRRICPGYNLGLKMVHSSLANLLHGFNLTLPVGMTPSDVNMEEIYGLTSPMKHPVVVVLEPRLPAHLYSFPPRP